MINTAKAAKVELFIWSRLMSVTEASGSKYIRVDHFDGKAAITAYGRQSGVPFIDV
jgi:NmrA-like family